MNFPKLTHQVSIIVPSWNNLELLQKFVPNIKKTTKLDTKLFVALNEPNDGSVEYLRSENIQFVVLNENYGTLAVDFLTPFLQSEYVVNMNDDSLLYHGWDEDLVNLIKEYYPAAAQVRGIEKGMKDGIVCIGDTTLPDWLDESAESVFFDNVRNGKYKCDLIHALFHPICCKTEDFYKVYGYGSFDLNWLPGHSLDTFFAWKLWNMNHDYKFLSSNSSFYYHGSSLTNNKVRNTNPELNNRHNSDYFKKITGITQQDFHKIIKYGQKVI
jgi:GT2 family glycosyltransferase